MSPMSRSEAPSASLMYVRAARSLSLDIRPLEMFVETRLVAIFDAHLILTDECLDESLHSIVPHAPWAFPSCFQGFLGDVVAWIREQ